MADVLAPRRCSRSRARSIAARRAGCQMLLTKTRKGLEASKVVNAALGLLSAISRDADSPQVTPAGRVVP